jgi:hypothetical protein
MDKEKDLKIRCIGNTEKTKNRVRNFSPYIAFNPMKLRLLGYEIQDTEIEEKEAAYNNKNTGKVQAAPKTKKENKPKKSVEFQSKEAVQMILKMKTKEEINEFMQDEVRKTINDVADKRIEDLTEAE